MKKVLSAVLAAIVMVTALSGCNNNTPNESGNSQSSNQGSSGENSNNNSSSTTEDSSSSSSTSEESSSSSSSDSSSASEDSSGSSSTTEDSSGDGSSASGDTSSNSVPGGYDTSNEYGLPLPDSRAGELAAKALAADSWGNISMLGEEEVAFLISEDLKFDMLEDYCFLYPMITGRKMLIFIAKAKAGNEDAVKAIFDERYNYYKNDPNAAFYLAEQEDVKGTVSGETNDNYFYIIVHPNGPDIQSVMS